MSAKKPDIQLPIGRTAMMARRMDSLRTECCAAAQRILRRKVLSEAELEECARLDDALAEAQRLLRSTVSKIMISRLRRRKLAR
jgi:hypothetical protein